MKDQLLNEVENIVTKGEIAYREQFLPMPLCFKQELSEDSTLDYMPLIHIKHYFIILHLTKYY